MPNRYVPVTDGTIDTDQIIAGAITAPKIADGAVGAIAIADGSISGAKIAAGSITGGASTAAGSKIADGTIETAQLKDKAITAAKIADATITVTQLANNAVETAQLKDGVVTAAKIANATITVTQLADNAVETAKIKDANVTVAKLVDNSITLAKMATSQYLGQPDTLYSKAVAVTRPILFAMGGTVAAGILTSGTLRVAPIYLRKGQVVTNITFTSTGAANTPTNWWFALYDSSKNLLRQTADQGNAAWGASTAKTLALSSPYTVLADGVFYVGFMMKATTPITLSGYLLAATVTDNGSTNDTGLTTTAPDPFGTVTAIANVSVITLT